MADLRSTPTLDDFQRPAENPLCFSGAWGCATSSDAALWTPLQLNSAHHATHAPGSVSSDSYWVDDFDSSASYVEAWAIMGGGQGGGSGLAYSLDLWQQPGGTNAVDGYRYRLEASLGGTGTTLYRVSNAGFTGLVGGSNIYGDGNVMLMRVYNSGLIECYAGPPGAMVLNITTTDGTFTGAFHPGIGIVDNSSSGLPYWTAFGGGTPSTRHTRIIRWVKN